MAQRIFNFTLPANANYYSVLSQIQAKTGFSGVYMPQQGCELILCSDTIVIKVADGNFANCPGVPVQPNGNITMRSSRNSIDLSSIFVSGSGAAISGVFQWI